MNNLRKPEWIKKNLFRHSQENSVKELINKTNLHTVCQEARCPNIGECFANKKATFLLLGNICTRNCKFCNISIKKSDLSFDANEPVRVAKAVKNLELKYVVLTSVTRDDLSDGGAGIFVQTVKEIKKINPEIIIEVLVPDFLENINSILSILRSEISVFTHNLETIKILYPKIRPMANYERSLNVLKIAKQNSKKITIKTGIMVGLGETQEQIEELMKNFYNIGGEVLTIGQYLSPGKKFYPVKEYIRPEIFDDYYKIGKKIGIKKIFSAPFVRSSYLSEKFFFNEI
ncbi:MAG: lipoyl synthase [Spirochaetes bacterium]|nr:lipoyl synthase [Spirochaetota bacterium]